MPSDWYSYGGKTLSDAQIAQFCYGRIILARTYSSIGKETCPHFAVMLDSNEEIAEQNSLPSPKYSVAFVSNNKHIDPRFIVPVPPRTGLTGSFICSWTPFIDFAAILDVRPVVLKDEEMTPIEKMSRECLEFQRKKRSTQS
jgi:hypothetical protein